MSSENADISCDTESTEERKFSNLETEVRQSDIRANATSDLMPEYECDHRYIDRFGTTMDFRLHFTGHLETLKRYAFCPKCGEKL
jgi:hypothetical protein